MLQLFNQGKSKRGFTLVELLVVIAIIGILATIVMVSLNTARQKARDVRRLADLRQVALALEMYYDDNPTTGYPGSGGGDEYAGAMTTALEGGGHIASVPGDPGTGSYEYWVDGSNNQAYVLKATLEDTGHSALNDDVDGGNIFGCDCGTPPDDPEGYYCLKF